MLFFLLTLIINLKTIRMKKFYILILFSICSFFSKAQYTLTSATNPVIGDVEKTWPVDTTGISSYTASSGTGQSWVYTMLAISPTAAAVSNSYVAVSSAPNSAAFPGANLAKTSDNMNYRTMAVQVLLITAARTVL